MRLMLAVLLMVGLLMIPVESNANDDGTYTIRGNISCSDYLDAYSRTTIDDDYTYTGPHQAWDAFGFINGYLTSYNAFTDNGKKDIAAGLSGPDVYRWIASWCRDNQSSDLADGLSRFILSR